MRAVEKGRTGRTVTEELLAQILCFYDTNGQRFIDLVTLTFELWTSKFVPKLRVMCVVDVEISKAFLFLVKNMYRTYGQADK